ncbi:MAG: glycine dehydrogenase, partial [Micrococcales bacterium]
MPKQHENFSYRHIGTTKAEQQRMLQLLGYGSLDSLMGAAVPEVIQFRGESTLDEARTEAEALAELRVLAGKNRVTTSMIGLGYFGTLTPGVIKRNVLENPSWYTAYTPYQPEISQGRLEALINFQTMVTDLTGMKTANASMLDEGTAAVEAMMIAKRSASNESNVFFVDSDVLPQTKALLEHRAEPLDISIEYFDAAASAPAGEHFGSLTQYPGASGRLVDLAPIITATKAQGGLAIAAADLLALTLVVAPGDLSADVVVGTTQRFGVPMGFGGPHAGYLAVREDLERSMPGRLVGVSVDKDGAAAYRLTLQTREQHIRRERATSNICTAQVLLAVMAAMYAVYHGPAGLRAIAHEVHSKTTRLASGLTSAGIKLAHDKFFDTLELCDVDANALYEKARAKNITLLVRGNDCLQLSLDETTDEK